MRGPDDLVSSHVSHAQSGVTPRSAKPKASLQTSPRSTCVQQWPPLSTQRRGFAAPAGNPCKSLPRELSPSSFPTGPRTARALSSTHSASSGTGTSLSGHHSQSSSPSTRRMIGQSSESLLRRSDEGSISSRTHTGRVQQRSLGGGTADENRAGRPSNLGSRPDIHVHDGSRRRSSTECNPRPGAAPPNNSREIQSSRSMAPAALERSLPRLTLRNLNTSPASEANSQLPRRKESSKSSTSDTAITSSHSSYSATEQDVGNIKGKEGPNSIQGRRVDGGGTQDGCETTVSGQMLTEDQTTSAGDGTSWGEQLERSNTSVWAGSCSSHETGADDGMSEESIETTLLNVDDREETMTIAGDDPLSPKLLIAGKSRGGESAITSTAHRAGTRHFEQHKHPVLESSRQEALVTHVRALQADISFARYRVAELSGVSSKAQVEAEQARVDNASHISPKVGGLSDVVQRLNSCDTHLSALEEALRTGGLCNQEPDAAGEEQGSANFDFSFARPKRQDSVSETRPEEGAADALNEKVDHLLSQCRDALSALQSPESLSSQLSTDLDALRRGIVTPRSVTPLSAASPSGRPIRRPEIGRISQSSDPPSGAITERQVLKRLESLTEKLQDLGSSQRPGRRYSASPPSTQTLDGVRRPSPVKPIGGNGKWLPEHRPSSVILPSLDGPLDSEREAILMKEEAQAKRKWLDMMKDGGWFVRLDRKGGVLTKNRASITQRRAFLSLSHDYKLLRCATIKERHPTASAESPPSKQKKGSSRSSRSKSKEAQADVNEATQEEATRGPGSPDSYDSSSVKHPKSTGKETSEPDDPSVSPSTAKSQGTHRGRRSQHCEELVIPLQAVTGFLFGPKSRAYRLAEEANKKIRKRLFSVPSKEDSPDKTASSLLILSRSFSVKTASVSIDLVALTDSQTERWVLGLNSLIPFFPGRVFFSAVEFAQIKAFMEQSSRSLVAHGG